MSMSIKTCLLIVNFTIAQDVTLFVSVSNIMFVTEVTAERNEIVEVKLSMVHIN